MKRIFSCIVTVMAFAFFAFMFNACSDNVNLFTLEEQSVELREKKDKCKTKVISAGNITIDNAESTDQAKLAGQIKTALENAAVKAKSPIKDALIFAASESNILAAKAIFYFVDLDALTMDYFYTILKDGEITFVVITIQLYKPNPNPDAIKKLKEHEDGHSYIANEVAKKIAKKAAEENDCEPNKTREAIQKQIAKASGAYDAATNHGQKGNQAKEAKKAAQKVIKEYLKS